MPNIKTSAKNRKQLNKLFSLNYDADVKSSNPSSVLHTTRTQSPDHYSESGVFSLSEYEQSVKNHKRNTNTNSDYFSNPDDSPFNTKPKLLRSNSKPKFVLDSPEPPAEKQPVSSNKNSNNSNNVEIVGKKLMSNGNANVAQSQAYAGSNNNNNVNSQKKKAAALKSKFNKKKIGFLNLFFANFRFE
jgi:hypothetical protein